MMLLLAHLLKLNPEWCDSQIVVRSIAQSEEESELQEQGMKALLEEVRIAADMDIIEQTGSQTIVEIIHKYSAGAGIVFPGMKDPAPGTEAEYAQRLEHLPTTVLVRMAGKIHREVHLKVLSFPHRSVGSATL